MKENVNADKKFKELVSQRKYDIFLKSIDKSGRVSFELKPNRKEYNKSLLRIEK